jgi:hypothetical protein
MIVFLFLQVSRELNAKNRGVIKDLLLRDRLSDSSGTNSFPAAGRQVRMVRRPACAGLYLLCLLRLLHAAHRMH